VSTSVLAQQAPLKQGKGEWTDKTFEFGSVPQGSVVAHDFTFKNVGTADLQIQRVTPSCGCTATSVSSSTIKAGETGTIKVEFDTAGFSGSKTKTVEVLTSDLETPEVLLTVRGTILPGVTTKPGRVEFGEISPGAEESAWQRNFRIDISDRSALKVSKVSSFSKFITVQPLSGNSGEYMVRLSSDAPRGEFRDRVVIEFEGGHQAPLNVPVIASIRGDLRIVPSTVSFGVIEGSAPIERRVRFDNTGTKPVKILSVESHDSAVSVSKTEVQPGKRAVLVVRLDPAKITQDLRASVDVVTDHPTENRLTMSVYAIQPAR